MSKYQTPPYFGHYVYSCRINNIRSRAVNFKKRIIFWNLRIQPPRAVHARPNGQYWKRIFDHFRAGETLRDLFLWSLGREKSPLLHGTLADRSFFNTPPGAPYNFNSDRAARGTGKTTGFISLSKMLTGVTDFCKFIVSIGVLFSSREIAKWNCRDVPVHVPVQGGTRTQPY